MDGGKKITNTTNPIKSHSSHATCNMPTTAAKRSKKRLRCHSLFTKSARSMNSSKYILWECERQILDDDATKYAMPTYTSSTRRSSSPALWGRARAGAQRGARPPYGTPPSVGARKLAEAPRSRGVRLDVGRELSAYRSLDNRYVCVGCFCASRPIYGQTRSLCAFELLKTFTNLISIRFLYTSAIFNDLCTKSTGVSIWQFVWRLGALTHVKLCPEFMRFS